MASEPTRAALNASQYGTGKTVVSVEVAASIKARTTLIACPLFTKYSWATTIKRQYPNAKVNFIDSSKSGRIAIDDLLGGVPGWYIIGREYLASKNVKDKIALYSPNIDMFIYDECARWANRKSAGFRMMKTMKPKYKMALSATPYGNKFDNFYSITQWLWPKFEGHASYWKFVADHCSMAQVGDEDWSPFGPVIRGERIPGQFVSSLPCYVRLEKDFGEAIEETIYVELSSKERAIYDKFEHKLIVWLKDNLLVEKLPITKRIRLRQMSLGEVSYDPDTDTVYFDADMKSTKYETLKSIIEEYPDEPILILTDSAKFAEIVALRLIVDGYNALPWTGRVSEDARHAMKEVFEADAGLDYIVATIPSIGEGVDGLQHRAHIIVWLSRSENNMLNQQALRRLLRRGQTKQVISIDIAALGTYDEGMLSNLIQQTLAMNKSLKRK